MTLSITCEGGSESNKHGVCALKWQLGIGSAQLRGNHTGPSEGQTVVAIQPHAIPTPFSSSSRAAGRRRRQSWLRLGAQTRSAPCQAPPSGIGSSAAAWAAGRRFHFCVMHWCHWQQDITCPVGTRTCLLCSHAAAVSTPSNPPPTRQLGAHLHLGAAGGGHLVEGRGGNRPAGVQRHTHRLRHDVVLHQLQT